MSSIYEKKIEVMNKCMKLEILPRVFSYAAVIIMTKTNNNAKLDFMQL